MKQVLVATGPGMAYGFRRGGLPDGTHYFRPDRFDTFWAEAKARGLDRRVATYVSEPATDAEVGLFHDLGWWAEARRRCDADTGAFDHGATPCERGLDTAALAMVGAVIEGARRALDGRRVFVPVSGFHHGRPAAALNYCLLNDCAIVLRWLLANGVARPAYVDVDVHFGDGVWETLPAGVVAADLHQDGGTFWYGADPEPGTSSDATRCSVSLPPGADDGAFFDAWAPVEAWLDARAPDFVVLQAGADGLAGDRLGGLALSEAVHRRVTGSLCRLADRHAGGRVLVLGGGGYHPGNLARAWCAVVEGLLSAG